MTTPAQPVEAVSVPAAGAIARQDFGGQELAVMGDVSAQRAGAEARALVEARFVMAMRRPRDLDDVRVKVLREVERPGFAEIAWYRKPVGDGVEGLSIRFFEAAARSFGNLSITPTITYEDERKRVIRVEAMDLETNYTTSTDITVEKTVERKSLSDGRVAISVRMNSQKKPTYTVAATEDELLGKTNALVSKARRNLIAQLLPGDITDQAKTRILAIRNGQTAKDPEGARRKIIDSFAVLNVMPSDLKTWLGHDVATASPAELTELRDLYSAIHAGEATWADALAEKVGEPEKAEGAAATPKPGLAGVTERLQKAAPAAVTPEPSAPPAATAPPPADCAHELARGHLADRPVGTVVVCPDCTADIRRIERQPGDEDDVPIEVTGTAAPKAPLTKDEARAEIQALAGAEPAKARGQRRLVE